MNNTSTKANGWISLILMIIAFIQIIFVPEAVWWGVKNGFGFGIIIVVLILDSIYKIRGEI